MEQDGSGSGTDGFPVLSLHDVPTVTAEQMREVDRAMVEDLGIEPLQMMETPAAVSPRWRCAGSLAHG